MVAASTEVSNLFYFISLKTWKFLLLLKRQNSFQYPYRLWKAFKEGNNLKDENVLEKM